MLVAMKIGVVMLENNLEVFGEMKNGYTLSPCEFFQMEHMEGYSFQVAKQDWKQLKCPPVKKHWIHKIK